MNNTKEKKKSKKGLIVIIFFLIVGGAYGYISMHPELFQKDMTGSPYVGDWDNIGVINTETGENLTGPDRYLLPDFTSDDTTGSIMTLNEDGSVIDNHVTKLGIWKEYEKGVKVISGGRTWKHEYHKNYTVEFDPVCEAPSLENREVLLLDAGGGDKVVYVKIN